MKKLLTLLCTLTLVCGLGSLHAFAETASPLMMQSKTTADDGTPYSYQVRIYAGKSGSFNTAAIPAGEGVIVTADCITITGVGENADALDKLGLGSITSWVTPKVDEGATTSRYYPQGFRLSGRDNGRLNSETNPNDNKTITPEARADGDTDYVVAYGIAGNLVQYTVQYLRAGDNYVLHTEDVLMGNIGEKPVVAYRYIDGYLPQAYSLAKTLSKDPAENVFTFYYTPVGGVIVQNETVTDYGTTVVEVPGTVTGTAGVIGGGGGAGAGGGAAAGPGAGAAVVGPDAGPGGGGAVDIPPNDTPLNNTPQEIVDLDEDQSALGNLELDEDTTNRFSLFGAVVGAMAGVAGLGWLLWFLLVGRKRRKEEDEA